jgi:ubiquinone/menaquinone biosynthesis C-methylase UbiE
MSTITNNNDREKFNEWSKTYERSFMQWLLFDRIHRGVLHHLPANFTPSHILDIGCGTGRLLRRMHTKWPSAVLVGVDPSEGMIEQAHTLTPEAILYQASAEQLPLEDRSVELVSSTISIHHWSDQDQGIREIWRVLRHEGFFVLVDVNIGHGHPLSRLQVRSLFIASGLSIYSQNSPVPFITFTVGEKL